MQPTARDGLSTDQVTALIRDADPLVFDIGLELIDPATLTVIEDISDGLAGGTVSRQSYATLHGNATLFLTRDLDWGTATVRPYVILGDGNGTSTRFNLGAYATSSPTTDVSELPITHEVTGYDILLWLNQPAGEAFSVAAGDGVLSTVEQILLDQGMTQYIIDQTAAASMLPSARSWPFSEDTTWLNIVNDLLGMVGYMGLYSDWDGRLRAQPYQLPGDRQPEWLYDAGAYTSTMDARRAVTRDFFDAPNRWVFYWSADPEQAAPIEGAGKYTVVNQNEGPTSVEARGGRVITARPQRLDVVSQDALVAAAQITIDADLRLRTSFSASTVPNPLHWHFDKVTVDDPALSPLVDVLVTRWELPLNGDLMTHEWVAL